MSGSTSRSGRWCSCGNRSPNRGDALLKRVVTPPLHEAGTRRWAAINLSPIVLMTAGWLAPLLMFWLILWGPLRPYHYPQGDFAPPLWRFVLSAMGCIALAWLPAWWFRVHAFERSGRFYEAIGVRWFRRFVPDGDLVNRWRRRRDPDHRIIRGRAALQAFVARTRASEKGHLILLAMGILSAAHAWRIGWQGWAVYITVGNVLVNLLPILLQRYTRARLQGVLAHG